MTEGAAARRGPASRPASSTPSSRPRSATPARSSPDLVASARAKMEQSAALRSTTLGRCADQVEAAGAAMADRFTRGRPPVHLRQRGQRHRRPGHGRPVPPPPARPAAAGPVARGGPGGAHRAVQRRGLRARLLAPAHRPRPRGDIAIGLSTSGDSVDLLRAFEEASRRGLLTIGLCGYEGSGMAVSDAVRHCLVVRSESVHRIQETQDALGDGAVGGGPAPPPGRCHPPESGGPRMTETVHGPTSGNGDRRPRGGGVRAHRGLPAPTAPAARRGRHPRPRRRGQGVGRPPRCRVPARLRPGRGRGGRPHP